MVETVLGLKRARLNLGDQYRGLHPGRLAALPELQIVRHIGSCAGAAKQAELRTLEHPAYGNGP